MKSSKAKSSTLLQALPSTSLKTAVIVCNGPSLADVPNDWLAQYTTYGANRVFLKEGFIATYLSVFDIKMVYKRESLDAVVEAFKHVKEGYVSPDVGRYFIDAQIKKPDNVRVFNWKNLTDEAGRYLAAFSLNPEHVVNSGGTVTYVNMQIAWWHGYRRLLCVGLDHNFTGPRGDHFTPDYNEGVGIPYAKGNKNSGMGAGKWYWNSKRYYEKTEAFYKIARAQFKGEIYNLTPDTKLDSEIFPVGSIDEWTTQSS